MCFELVVARTHRDWRKVGILTAFFSEQRNDTIRRCRSENDVSGFLEDGVQIENRAERLAHLIKRAQDVCFALQRLQDFVSLRRCCYFLFRTKHRDRKSTRLNSSHVSISYAVFCLKKKKLG